MATKVPNNETTEALDALEPVVTEKYYVISEGNDDQIAFVQKPLSFFGKIEFFSVVGTAVEKILSDGGSLSELLDMPEYDPTKPLTNNATDADVFIKALAKIVQSAPEILTELYLVILAVPRGQREYVGLRLNELSDDQGVEILDTFVDQNWEVMVNFFKEKLLPLFNKISTKVQE